MFYNLFNNIEKCIKLLTNSYYENEIDKEAIENKLKFIQKNLENNGNLLVSENCSYEEFSNRTKTMMEKFQNISQSFNNILQEMEDIKNKEKEKPKTDNSFQYLDI